MTTGNEHPKRGANSALMIPFVLIIIAALSVSGYFGRKAYVNYAQEQKLLQESRIQESQVQAELAAMRQTLDQNVFYAGIWIGDLSLEGMTYQQVQTELQKQDSQWRQSFGATLKLASQSWPLTASDAGLVSDWPAILDLAWQTGRTSAKTEAVEQVRERYAAVEALKQNPLRLKVTRSYDEAKVRALVASIAASVEIKAVGATATAFDPVTQKFTVAEQKPGFTVNGEACADEIIELLAGGRYGESVTFTAKTVTGGMTAAAMQSKLGLVSQAVTYARKVNPNRDNNITLICKKLNGLLIQPGETFSFNGTIGERTAAKGYKEAGGIRDGILIAELGGGICQPNTTLCHAVLKADLQIVERHPHSWPSDYVPVGLDATVTWGGADFKFKNNTNYPIAIVASYKKPNILFQIYGRQLESGVTIDLEAVHNGFIQESAPKETYNSNLAPGERVEIRAPHTGQRATAYKVWKKNGVEIKRAVAFTSYYRPIQGVYEYGPKLTTG